MSASGRARLRGYDEHCDSAASGGEGEGERVKESGGGEGARKVTYVIWVSSWLTGSIDVVVSGEGHARM